MSSLVFWIAIAFMIYVLGDLFFIIAIRKKLKKHEIQLRIKHANGYTLGWNDAVEKIDEVVEAYFERPKNMVHHCNRKTNYEMIIHPFDPDNCENCKEIKGLLQEDPRLTLEA